MRERSGIDDDGVARRALLLDPIDQLPLVVRLQAGQPEIELAGALREQRFQVGERLGAVDLGLAPPERAQVGTVEDQDLHTGSTSASDDSTMDGSTD